MAVTLTGEDRTAHLGMDAVAPAELLEAGEWQFDDTPVGDDICTGRLAVGPGFSGTLDLSLVRPEESSQDISVKLFRRYLDAAGNTLSEFVSDALDVDGDEATHTLALTTAPELTANCEYGLRSNTTPLGTPTVVRTNEYDDPRNLIASRWIGKNTDWNISTATDPDDIVPGVASYIACTVSGTYTSTERGPRWYQDTGDTPVAGNGFPVTPGDTITVSAYVRSSRAGSVLTTQFRFSAGTSWVAAATVTTHGTVTANTWKRVSVTLTVPAGSVRLIGRWLVTPTATWTSGDHVDIAGVMVEKVGSLGDYFDGGTVGVISGEVSSAWEGDEFASRSFLYDEVISPALVRATSSVLSYSADAEEVLGAALERDLRRTVADIWGSEQPLVTAGTPALLSGSITYLCESLAQAFGVDSVYRMGGLITLASEDELNGLTHRAVGKSKISPEKVLPGRTPKWLLQIEFREQR